MKKEEFISLLKQYQTFQDNCAKYYDYGIDLYESKFPTWDIGEKFFNIIIALHYNQYGIDWINWFVYENDFGEKQMGAWDGETLICQTMEDLYLFIQQYRI